MAIHSLASLSVLTLWLKFYEKKKEVELNSQARVEVKLN